jgi:hypothetical protein
MGFPTSVHLRLDRAQEHLDTLRHEVGVYARSHPYTVVLDEQAERNPVMVERQGVYEPAGETMPVVVGDVQPVPDMVPLLVGEVAHNLRTTLDHLAWALVTDHSADDPVSTKNRQGREPFTAFPISDWPPNNRDGNGLPSPHLLHPRTTDAIEALIDGLQPYQRTPADEHELAVIRGLNNADKHRTLHTALAVIGVGRVMVTYPSGRISGQRGRLHVRYDGEWRQQALEPGAQVGSVFVAEWEAELLAKPGDMEVDADLEVVVTLDEPGTHVAHARPVADVLQSLLDFVRRDVVPLFTPLF